MTSITTDIARVRELLNYEADTGILRWKAKRHGTASVGSQAGSINSKGYRCVKIDGKLYQAHRIAWVLANGEWPARAIDHKNRNRDDNRIENLRLATNSQNKANSKKPEHNTSGLKGVTWHKLRQKWAAQICKDGKNIHLGLFTSANEAHEAYIKAANQNFGEFARSA